MPERLVKIGFGTVIQVNESERIRKDVVTIAHERGFQSAEILGENPKKLTHRRAAADAI